MGSSTFFTNEVFSGSSRLSEKTVHRALQIDHGSRVQYVVLGPAGFTLWRNFGEAKKVYNTNETFRRFIDLFAFLSSIKTGK